MTDAAATIVTTFSDEELAAIDAWIARAPEPRPDRANAVRQLVAGRLGVDGASTMIPGLVTGRDIV